MRALITGGGTGGHINPALAIASIIKEHEPDSQFLFAGTPFGMEARLIPEAGYDFAPIKVRGFQRKISLENIRRNAEAAAYLVTAMPRAKQIIKEFRPDVVIGTGGYVSGPVVHQAAKLGIPTVIHEQNAYPGVTTRILTKKVDKVMLTVKEALDYLGTDIDYTVTGLPVRAELFDKTKEEARKELGFDDSFTVLSFGGSLGAGCINETMAEVIKYTRANDLKINHIHGYGGMGKDTFPAAMKKYGVPMKSDRTRITEYINDMDTCMAAADLVVCRSGATTLAELEAMGKPAILIPSPIVAGNHQFHNANVLGKAGAAVVIEQKNVRCDEVIKIIEDLYNDPARVREMSECSRGLWIDDTSEKIWQTIDSVVKKS
ncbi:undecaprenyldiphospho-muramoylpentapeptide beta-N-acetylglucosaminyltransferase [Ruminococcus sp. HUN007]|uniref:undecaprenyldiphospho-muramoylpentapeptide beta-N-acetylglucosaminyltransferase n=1 Tax=Ruminococcus sp. HUN007 TaxID=1514668 RepID=UPI0005D2039F|nr:undecaprenyldiphospho-muramoylpentapeptide beta-N-acetylglucosaminyltransferase [Ruminococcus sp. HUN007]